MTSLATLSEYLTLQGCRPRSTKRLTEYLDQSSNGFSKIVTLRKYKNAPKIFYSVSAGGMGFLLKKSS